MNASFSLDELQAAGVRRVTTGGALARAAFGELMRAAHEMHDHGTFTIAKAAIPHAEITALMPKTTH
jgi:2-methylisocitrate lyase-like PEP mutase family enzyme